LEILLRDVRHVVRSLVRSPVSSLAGVVTLALCIGANTTIFTLINSFYQGLPVERPGGLVSVYTSSPTFGAWGRTSYPDFVDYRDRNEVFENLAADSSFDASMVVDGSAEWVLGGLVTGNYFSVLGVEAVVGRTFTPDEQKPGGPPVLVLSYELWQRRFAGDEKVVGRVVKLNQRDFTIVGVAPKRFKGTMAFLHPDLWIPMHHLGLAMPPAVLEMRAFRWVAITGRLRGEVSMERAQANFDTLAAVLEKAHPETPGNERKAALIASTWIPPAAREWYLPTAKLLLWAVLLLLLIACVNVTNLLLAKTNARRAETGMQLALGARRARLVRRLFVESFLLAFVGAVLGLPLAVAASRWVAGYFGPAVPGAPGNAPVMEPDLRVYALTFGVCLLTALISSAVPAFQLARSNPSAALREQRSQDKPSPLRLTWGSSLVVVQIALCFALLIGAKLIGSSLRHLLTSDPGYKIENVLLAAMDLQPAGYDAVRGRRFFATLLDELAALPGVSGASLAEVAPLSGYSQTSAIRIPEMPDQNLEVDSNVVGPGYFETLGIAVLRGRGLTARDTLKAPGAIVVNESFARKFFPKGEAVGRRIRLGRGGADEPADFAVVGVVEDTKYLSLGEDPRPLLYVSVQQRFRPRLSVVLRTMGDASGVMAQTRQKIKSLDADVPVIYVTVLSQYLNQSIWEQRLRAEVLQAFGLLALGLAAVGVFSLMTYNVTRRWREIGIRMALGADRRGIVAMVVRETLRLSLVGIVLGMPLAIWGKKLLASFLVGVGGSGAGTFAGVAVLLAGVALLASWLPAWRASRMDSMAAIRAE
jgi:predicted permease